MLERGLCGVGQRFAKIGSGLDVRSVRPLRTLT